MIAFDTNLLVYAHRQDSQFHIRAKECLRAAAEGRETWSIPWPSVHEFLAVVSNPRIFKTPTPLEAALAQVAAWMRSPTLILLGEEQDAYWEVFCRIARSGKISGTKVHDARIAALVTVHGIDELLSADRDFSRFPELKLRNPL